MFDALGKFLDRLVLPLSVTNIVVLSLVLAIIALVVMLFVSPDLDATFNRGVRGGQDDPFNRMLRQLRSLRTSDRGMREQATMNLFFEGNPARPVDTSGDFFLLL